MSSCDSSSICNKISSGDCDKNWRTAAPSTRALITDKIVERKRGEWQV